MFTLTAVASVVAMLAVPGAALAAQGGGAGQASPAAYNTRSVTSAAGNCSSARRGSGRAPLVCSAGAFYEGQA
jgi:hypothetical protein